MTRSRRFDGLAVVVVNYRSSHLLAEGLVDVARDLPGADIIVVDNFSTPSEHSAVTELTQRNGWQLVSLPRNLGFGAGCNVGAETAWERAATRILLLNPDATIDAESVSALEDAVDADPFALVAPVVRRPDGSVWSSGNHLDLDTGRMIGSATNGESAMAWLSGACLLVSRSLWDRVGGFDDAYFLYWEDVDLSARVTAAGGTLRVLPDAVSIHAVGGTQQTSGRAKSEAYYYFNIRNRFLFADQHLDAPAQRRWKRTALPAAREIVLRGGRRQFLHPVAIVRSVSTALADGHRGRWGRGTY